MTRRIALFGALILSLVVLPGCPDASSAQIGTWAMSMVGGSDIGLEIQASGMASVFLMGTTLDRTFTWEVNGSEFLLRQVLDDNMWIVVANIDSDTSLNGTRVKRKVRAWDYRIPGPQSNNDVRPTIAVSVSGFNE
jgi:hypothetical protein